MPTIPRKLPNASLAEWNEKKPTLYMAREHLERVIRCAPASWQAAIRGRFDNAVPPVMAAVQTARDFLEQPPEWAQAWDLMQAIADFEDEFGAASLWNLDDQEICTMAKKLAGEADELDALAIGLGATLADRVDSIRLLVRCVGITEDKPIQGEPAIKRAQDAAWWRRRLRVHVARVVEGGNLGMGLVHKGRGGYVSDDGLRRRGAQLKRNAEALERTLYRNEAGQVFTLRELAELGTANPINRGGELMTRIRGAEEYADARAHVGLFITLTLPSKFHPMKLGSGGRVVPNKRFVPGTTPRHGQLWLRDKWAKTRAALARKGVRMYGLRVAEPHHDATPHWHALIWAEDEAGAQAIEDRIRHYWLSDDGDERGAAENRVNIKRMVKGGAAGYVAKYIAKSVGHLALVEHQDVVDGQQIVMDFGPTDPKNLQETGAGHRRVDAWAATWGIRQFQTIGMPSVTVWREMRRVTKDQLELFTREGDRDTVRAYQACHRHGNMRADWRLFMEAMGGHALPRCRWHLRTAHRTPEAGQVNRYGEEVKVGRVVGLRAQRGRMCGHWLVSRRIAWTPVIGEGTHAAHGMDAGDAAGQAQGHGNGPQGAQSRAALAAPWTGFNNCTARITHELSRLAFGRGDHEIEDWCTPEVVAHYRALREAEPCPW
ncbi:replication endonuclease [Alicycliphilus denitrificans]|uniref:replication endonuclease n=1 Tax=Alicycliphilus denitrificans TaxID=179636 RepID=UPI0001DA0226|nr:replication endonuclease [Alicycliphilus denitrificans]ADU99003.1 replication protein A [Alicycliphilus denitrificans BC]